jgi:hypothetical protein
MSQPVKSAHARVCEEVHKLRAAIDDYHDRHIYGDDRKGRAHFLEIKCSRWWYGRLDADLKSFTLDGLASVDDYLSTLMAWLEKRKDSDVPENAWSRTVAAVSAAVQETNP